MHEPPIVSGGLHPEKYPDHVEDFKANDYGPGE